MAGGVSLVESWSLEPIGRVQIGPDEYPVPPLTFGRFQRLLALDAQALMQGMVGGDATAAWPWVQVCVPGVTKDRWEAFCTEKLVADLFLMFGRAHDWAFVSDAIRFGEPLSPDETTPSLTDITNGMLVIAQKSGYKLHELHDLRVEAFYRLAEALRPKDPEEQPASTLPGIGGGGAASDDLLSRMRAAEGASDGD